MHVLEMLGAIAKAPFFFVFKALVAILNVVPVPVYETFGHADHGPEDRADLREHLAKVKGSRRLHLGSLIVAWQRGAVFRAHGIGKHNWLGVYSEDYEAIQKKWTF